MSGKEEVSEIAFGDIVNLTDREIQMVLREVDTTDLAVAMQGSSERMKDRIFSNISERVAAIIRDEMGFPDGIEPSRVEGMQLRIAQTVGQLVEAGQAAHPGKVKKALKRKPQLSKSYLSMKQAMKNTLKRPLSELTFDEITQALVGFAEIARKEGIFALDGMIEDMGDEFLAKGIRLAVDGTEPPLIVAILGTWMESLMHEHKIRYQKVIEGIMSIQSGDNPRIVEQKLNVLY